MADQLAAFDIPGIMSCQRNRYPMLFIDKITESVPLKYAKGYKLFSYNEWFFHGYETDSPKVWNVVQIEAMSQVFLMTFLSDEAFRGKIAVSNKFDKVQFFKKIEPGNRLDIEAELDHFKRGVARGRVKGFVNGELACSMACTIVVPELFGLVPETPDSNCLGQRAAFDFQQTPITFGIAEIKKCLLNKYPWLLIDGAVDVQPGSFVRAIKNFTYNEAFFPAHFEGEPSVPGFIQIESCMQSFLLTFLSLDDYKRRETADRLLSNVQVKRKIVPGETLEMNATLTRFTRGIAKGRVESFVNGEPAVSFDVTAVVVDELDKFKPRAHKPTME